MRINNFKNKSELFRYLIKKFIENEGTIILRGSMINKKIKNYDDFDLEMYTTTPRKPYYEVIFIEGKLCLISIWFGKYKISKSIEIPKDVKLIYGKSFSSMSYIKDKGKYSSEDKIKRESQAVIDWLFKYLRNKDLGSLYHVQKRIN